MGERPEGDVVEEGAVDGQGRHDMTFGDRVLLALLVVTACAIVLSSDALPMYDVPSHLATAVIAREVGAGDPFFREHYEVSHVPVPYWLTTFLVEPTLSILSPRAALRAWVVVFILALPLGYLALVGRTRGSPQLAWIVALAVFSEHYWRGGTNFLFGQALVPFAYVCFRDLDRWNRPAPWSFFVLVIAAYFAHVFVLASILGACGLAFLLSLLRNRMPHLAEGPARPIHGVALAWAAAWFALAVWFIFFQHGTEANTGRLLYDFRLHRLGNVFDEPLSSPTIATPIPAALLALVLAGAWLLPRVRARGASIAASVRDGLHLPTFVVAVAFTLLYWFGPVELEEIGGRIDEDICPRFLLIAFLFLLGSLRIRSRTALRTLAIAVVAFGAFRFHDAWQLHHRQTITFRNFQEEILERIPIESRVLPLTEGKDRWMRQRSYFYLFFGEYVVTDRHGYSPAIFAAPGQQFLKHARYPEHRDVFDLHVADWEWDYYDFVLVQTNKDDPNVPGLSDHASLAASTPDFRLFRIGRPER